VLRAVAASAEAVVPAAYRPQVPRVPAPPLPAEEPALMPDLRGRSAREAAIAAARRGLVVELVGSGRVLEQSPAPGAEIEPGNTCVLTLGREEDRP
jgi:cell division protein FtsI (penicillin-binding protein 3)